jgi:hypothetical protein
MDELFDPAFQKGDVTVYRVRTGALSAASGEPQ